LVSSNWAGWYTRVQVHLVGAEKGGNTPGNQFKKGLKETNDFGYPETKGKQVRKDTRSKRANHRQFHLRKTKVEGVTIRKIA